ncbi:COP9 signalosome complex subunit 5a [Thecamonas trahens ATCC 50062]|uniref:COP9 signalosome complex subunit 5 n=1 Tax=Thecamonas trahens ATCC 50062 TaxID=461836 RepID=A0A0L0DW79_THETB|nr:COP9 signalosome complex subunit 5a [Thecamonas trahens ATCC 50062]KNC55778.1 COP9 signalosome complex subunit 5a [Thecamonas trahens ATCC 50062]|eukprot:XP_013752860.1 COP9 signalosome complex subunit 5a [Thecamonas trahens ATCC 50062]
MSSPPTSQIVDEAGKAAARAAFDETNEVIAVDSANDLYAYNEEEIQKTLNEKKWKNDVHYFKRTKISAKALLKIVMHAHSAAKGERKTEIMGMLLGKVVGETIIVLDAFELPIQGEEAFVTAGDQANIYMSEYVANSKLARPENPIGWYHSHPGLQVFLSGTDCTTQRLYQQFMDPWLAIVIDPVRTMTSGKVELGAFRTYPPGTSAASASSGWEPVPADLIEEFGVHKDEYYKMETSYFKSASDAALLDLLWDQYWVSALATNALTSNAEYFSDCIHKVARKLEDAEEEMAHSSSSSSARFRAGGAGAGSSMSFLSSAPAAAGPPDSKLALCADESSKFAIEELHALTTQVVKDSLFNIRR